MSTTDATDDLSLLSLILSGVAVFIFILASAICSASETSVLASSRIRLHHLAQKGDARAQTILRLQTKMGTLISTILLANTWCITIVTALAAGVMTTLFGAKGTIYAGVVMSALVTIYGEVTPKIYVYSNPDRIALRLAPIFSAMVWVLSPITHAIDFIAKFSLKLAGVNLDANNESESSIEDLRGAIALHAGSSQDSARHERAMLSSILDLTNIEVGDIMTHRKRMFILDIDMPISELVEQVLKAPFTRIPLYQENSDNIIGILHSKDLLRALQNSNNNLEGVDLHSILIPAWFIPESTTLFAQLQAFREKREHFAMVVDEYGSLEGLVTLEDILEEIVGEIVDEHDIDLAGVRFSQGGTYIVEGSVSIRDLNRQFDWSLPDEDASTIAGLVIHESKIIPKPGQSFIIHGFRIDVLRRHRQQITQIRITPPTGKLMDA